MAAGVTTERGEEAFVEAPARFHQTCRDEMKKRIKQVEDITSERFVTHICALWVRRAIACRPLAGGIGVTAARRKGTS